MAGTTTPFGAAKKSTDGRDGGDWSLGFHMETQTVLDYVLRL